MATDIIRWSQAIILPPVSSSDIFHNTHNRDHLNPAMVQGYRAAKPSAAGQETAVYVSNSTFWGGGAREAGWRRGWGRSIGRPVLRPRDPQHGHKPVRGATPALIPHRAYGMALRRIPPDSTNVEFRAETLPPAPITMRVQAEATLDPAAAPGRDPASWRGRAQHPRPAVIPGR